MSSAQEIGQAANALRQYDIIQYASVSGYGPQNIILLDNNGDILLACKAGITEENLRSSGITFTRSQLVLLEAWRLLSHNDDTLKTLVPILDSTETFALRNYTKHVAALVCDTTVDLVRALKRHLDEIKRSRNAYSVIFSYVVDGLVWRHLEESKLLTQRTIGAENPFWAGEAWALFRPRTFSCGTNKLSDRGISMNVNWSNASNPKRLPFVADFKNLSRTFDDYTTLGRVVDTTARRVFTPFNLFNSEGEFTIPIIPETNSNMFYKVSIELSERIATAVLSALDTASLRATYHLRDGQQTLVIAYHEIMWDLMDAYEHKGLLKKPRAFSDPSHSMYTDISDLVFIVRQEKP
jgi:hypothetical protein